MKNKIALCLLVSVSTLAVANAQSHWDTLYVKDYTSRILWSYFQEYKTMTLSIAPSEMLRPDGKESLLLNSGNNLYSGLLIQYKGISLYFAGNLPQSEEDISRYGSQESSIWKLNIQIPSASLRVHHLNYSGFYNLKYENNELEAAEDVNAFERYSEMETSWLTAEIKHYPSFRRFAQGMPENFNLHQVKSNFAVGYRLGYDKIRINNKDRALFVNSLQNNSPAYTVANITYSGLGLAVGPSAYITIGRGFFLYGDVWIGVNGLKNRFESDSYESEQYDFSFSVPELRTTVGYQNRRWLIGTYYSFQNQSFQNELLSVSSTLNTFGVILGFRTNSPSRMAF